MLFRLSLVLGASASALLHADPFQNLGLDEARTDRLSVISIDPLRGTGPAEDLLPGWRLSKGGDPQATLGLNLNLLDLGYASLISADQSEFYRYPVEGAYALHLVGSPGNAEPFQLFQRGEIPADAQWLTLRYSGYGFSLRLDGREVPGAYPAANSQVFDVAGFRGKTVDLTLTALGPLMPTQSGASYLDSIAFTVPEPTTGALLVCGIVLLAWFGRGRSGANVSG